MTDPSRPSRLQSITRHVAFRALLRSMLINMAMPALLYHFAELHFATQSLWPLAIAGCPPVLWLAYSVITLRAIDFLGLFAAENVAVRVVALLLAHSQRGALIGRSLENVVLATFFLASLAFAKPAVFYMARQLATGNDPDMRRSFDITAAQPTAMRTYRVLTWGWALALLIKAAGCCYLAARLSTQDYLMFSPLWDLASDGVLVTWSILYGRFRLAPSAGDTLPPAAYEAVPRAP
jgi:hypothetical protein